VNKALLDTDTYSEVLKAVNPTVVQKAASYRQQYGMYSVSVVSAMEIVYGLQRMQKHRRLQNFLAAVAQEEVISFEHPAAELAGRISGDLDRTGQTIGKADPMIAAIDMQHGLELVTGNTSHYLRIQQLGYPLTLTDWRFHY
jgi:tRNA(fMet)-specific endonuclease VapC